MSGKEDPQAKHRSQILKHLQITPGSSHVLEVGCGQGDATVVLAETLGENGQITAIDPAPLDYGSPQTLGEAQAQIKSTALGSRISFVQSDPTTYVRSILEEWQGPRAAAQPQSMPDTAVLIHSLYYFSSRTQMSELFKSLLQLPSIQRLLIAEHALSVSRQDQIPHVLAAKALGALSESLDPATNTFNIRTLVTPDEIRTLASEAGWSEANQGTFTPTDGLQDGRWEVYYVCSAGERGGILKKVGKAFEDARDKGPEKQRVLKYREEMLQKLSDLGIMSHNVGEKEYLAGVRTMDTWYGEFTRASM